MPKLLTIPAEFAINGAQAPSPSLVPYTGKIFAIGEYPELDFSLTEAEADAAIAAFTPVDNDYEHHHGLFDGKLGTLQRVWREGTNLMGEMLLPRQVRELAGETLQTSLTWARETKRIIGNALTATPRISDATLVAAFTAALTDNMAISTQFAIHTRKKENAMTLKERFLALFNGGKTPEELSEDELTQFALAQRVDEQTLGMADPAIAGIMQRQLLHEAEALFTAALTQGKLLPPQHDSFVTLFNCLHKADHGGQVTFSQDGALTGGTGQQAMQIFLAALPENPALFTERLQTEAANGNLLTFASGDTSTPTPARMTALKRYANLQA